MCHHTGCQILPFRVLTVFFLIAAKFKFRGKRGCSGLGPNQQSHRVHGPVTQA